MTSFPVIRLMLIADKSIKTMNENVVIIAETIVPPRGKISLFRKNDKRAGTLPHTIGPIVRSSAIAILDAHCVILNGRGIIADAKITGSAS